MADVAGEEDEWLYGENVNEDQIKIDPEVANKLIEDDDEDPSSSSQRKEDDGDDDGGGDGGGDGTQNEGDESKDKEDDDRGSDGPGGSDEEDVDDEENDDDDSDDDGVQVVIGDLKAAPGSFGAGSKRSGPPPDKKGKFSVEDFESPGTINGVSALEFNVDNLEEKPWRKPGADITDYFNYGFTEETWRAYCDKQKRIRFETGAILTNPMSKMNDMEGSKPGGQPNIGFQKKFGQQPYQRIPIKQEPQENTIQVRVVNTADRRDNFARKGYDMPMVPPPFDLSVPPPPFRPEFMGQPPPEFFNRPPPPFYHEQDMPGYEEQQWMDSQWEGGSGIGASSSVSVVPLTKVPIVPPPPGEADDQGSSKDRK